MANFNYNARTTTTTTIMSTPTYITNTTSLASSSLSFSSSSSSTLSSTPATTILSSSSPVLQTKLSSQNVVANGFLIESSNIVTTPTPTTLHSINPKTPSLTSPPPPYHAIANSLNEKEQKKICSSTTIAAAAAADNYLQQQKLLGSKTELASETIFNDNNVETAFDAYGPTMTLNEPQKPRWLSSLHSVIFIITCALAVFIVFRNVLTW